MAETRHPRVRSAAAGRRVATSPDGLPLRERDRLLPFAFAGADLLLEVDSEGRIGFAIGAFIPRFGRPAESFVGAHVSALIAAEDQPAFAVVLAASSVHGRIPPLLLHLADRSRTLASLAGLVIPGRPARLCLSIGPAPAPVHGGETAASGLHGAATLARVAAASLADALGAQGAELGLLEVVGWSASLGAMSRAELRSLRAEIAAVLVGAAPNAVASEVADGRFGVVSPAPLDMSGITEGMEKVLHARPSARRTGVRGARVRLETGDLAAAQAGGALRIVLARFAHGGVPAATEAGVEHGLAGVAEVASTRARVVERAIAERRFRLQFQPIVQLSTGAVHHYEALIRPTPTPQMTLSNPQEFVTFVETVGLSEALDWAVLQEALRILGPAGQRIIAVNVSGLSVQSQGFRERAADLLTETSKARQIVFELTETAEIEDMSAAAATLQHLRGLGCRSCLDDLGAGAAGFRYLRALPFDFVKIDGAYVRAAPESARERSFVASMADLARSIGARTVAETIETESQRALMADLGIDLGQGWLFGRPGALPGAA